MKVALVITELAVGGAERAMFQLATLLDRARFEPTVFSLGVPESGAGRSFAPSLRSRGIETVELGARGVGDAFRVTRRLTRALREGGFTILQSFMYHANMVGRFAGRRAGVPLICSGIRVAERDSRWRLALDRLTGGVVDAWVCVGESVARFSVEEAGLPASRVYSIPNGVSITDEDLRPCGEFDVPAPFGRGRKRMIGVGRLTRQKGFDELLESAVAWLTPDLAREWELWLVGDGEDRAKLETLARRLGLGEFVFFAGWRPDARRLIAESELFVLPSRWEGMANALLESCALGKACLCRDTDGVSEILGAGSREQTSASVLSETWSERMTRLVTDGGLRARLGALNRLRATSEFSVESTARRYERLWLELLERKAVASTGAKN